MIKVLLARRQTRRYLIRVLLDDTKVDTDGNPISAWVREWEWARFAKMPSESAADYAVRVGEYEQMIRRTARLLATRELRRMTEVPGTALDFEGVTVAEDPDE